MSIILLIVGLALYAYAAYFDIAYSKKLTCYDMEEDNKLFRNKDGSPNIKRSIIVYVSVAGGILALHFLFNKVTEDATRSYFAGIAFLALGIVRFFRNQRLRKKQMYKVEQNPEKYKVCG